MSYMPIVPKRQILNADKIRVVLGYVDDLKKLYAVPEDKMQDLTVSPWSVIDILVAIEDILK